MKTLCRVGRRCFGRRMKWQKHQVLPFQSLCPIHFSVFPKNKANEPENFSTYPKNFSVVNVKAEKFSGKFFLSRAVISSQSDRASGVARRFLCNGIKMNGLQKNRLLFSR